MRRFFRKITGAIERFWIRNMRSVVITAMLAVFLLAYFWNDMVISIDSGHEGVMWKRFSGGTVLDKAYGEGVHLIFPWDRLYVYDVRIQEASQTIEFLENNGMTIKASVSIRFHPDRNTLPRLHKRVGPDYKNKLVIPELISAMRLVLGTKTYQKVYVHPEEEFLDEIQMRMINELTANDVELDQVLLTGLTLPETVSEAIQAKLVREQELQAYAFRLESEKKERRRKRIEAEGIADFERNANISILKWRGIKATEEFARSPNTKIVIIGNDAESLPVILNADQ